MGRMADRVVVTGASGYIGGHLVSRLARDGWDITALNRRRSSHPLPSSVTDVVADVTEYPTLARHVAGADAVAHLACLPLAGSRADPSQAFRTNALGSFNVLEACRAHGVPRIVIASTAYVYGNPVTVPITETHPTFPTTVYGASKLAGEAFASAYRESHAMQTVVLRIFNVFGPAVDGAPRPTVDSAFVERARAGLPVTIHGNPEDARDFVHVNDVVDGIASVLSSPAVGVYNIGAGKAYTLRDLALAAGVPSNALRFDGSRRPALTWTADITRAMEDFAFRPRRDVLEFVSARRQELDPAS